MKLFLKFTGGFYIFWSFMEVFLIFQTLTALDAVPESPIVRSFYLQIFGFFLKLVVGSMAFMVDRKREFALVGMIFAGIDAAFSIYTLFAWQQNRVMSVFYLVIDLTLLFFLYLVFSKWKKGGPAPFAVRRMPNRSAANVKSEESARPYPPVAPYPPVQEDDSQAEKEE